MKVFFVMASLGKMNAVVCECKFNAPVLVLKAQLGGKNNAALENELKCITETYQCIFYQFTSICPICFLY